MKEAKEAPGISIFNSYAKPPQEAIKIIKAGRLKGMSDINPQWRIRVLTEQFGLCGFGWKYEIVKQWSEHITNTDETLTFVNINLYIKVDGEWSDPIPGGGGSKMAQKESAGIHVSDECYKMALTDALSVACKAIGVASDIYEGKLNNDYPTGSKYDYGNKNNHSANQQSNNSQTTRDKAWLNPGSEEWSKVVVALTTSGYTISDVEKKYRISAKNKEKLQEEVLG